MKSLAELQKAFQQGILAGDEAILSEVNDSARAHRSALFGVYRNAYVARLAEILAEDYRHLHAYLGDERFAELTKAYIEENPSNQRNARWFGRHLPDFVQAREPYREHPELAELAWLEKALADAFDGPEANPLKLSELGEIAPELWPRLIFTSHPTVVRLSFRTNAADIWAALRDQNGPPPARLLPEPQALLVWREDVTARFRPFPPEEAMMWDEVVRGTRFGVLCEMVATFGGEDGAALRTATYLRNWVDREMLAGCRIG